MTLGAARPTHPVRVAVAGLGSMGRNHVRVLADLPETDLVAACDPRPEPRAAVARSRRIPTYPDLEQLLASEAVEAVVIAVPTSAHEDTTLTALADGLHVLVEKPLADDLEAAQRLVAAADAAGVVATVGHVERHNPVVAATRERLRSGELGDVYQLRSTRSGPLPERIGDVGVVVDLATHDFDLARHLIERPVERLYAETARRLHPTHEDLFCGILRFQEGPVGSLEVNWLTPTKLRELRILGEGGMYVVDLLDQHLWFHENSHPVYWEGAGGRPGVSEGRTIRFRIERAEPLALELRRFAAAIRGQSSELVTFADGLAAVALAEAVRESAESGLPVRPELTPYDPLLIGSTAG